jgi:hypothetical protein
MFDYHAPGLGQVADHREVQVPLFEDRPGEIFLAGLEHHQHALLAFREHHLIGGHVRLPAGHPAQVQLDPGAALGRHLEGRAGQARRAHILDSHDRVGGHELQAGFDQELLGERVADLDRRAFFLRTLTELR